MLNSAQLVELGLLAIALICAGSIPGKDRDHVAYAALCIVVSTALCIWSYAPMSLSQIIYNATGQIVMPLRIWAAQDAVLSCQLASYYILTRDKTVLIVGLLFMGQIALHVERQIMGPSVFYTSALDVLFLAMLGAIASGGVDNVIRNIRDGVVRYRRGRMGAGRIQNGRALYSQPGVVSIGPGVPASDRAASERSCG